MLFALILTACSAVAPYPCAERLIALEERADCAAHMSMIGEALQRRADLMPGWFIVAAECRWGA